MKNMVGHGGEKRDYNFKSFEAKIIVRCIPTHQMFNESLQPKIVEHILYANNVYQSNKLIYNSYIIVKHKKNITNLSIDFFKLQAASVYIDW